jgi:hypothetical protein
VTGTVTGTVTVAYRTVTVTSEPLLAQSRYPMINASCTQWQYTSHLTRLRPASLRAASLACQGRPGIDSVPVTRKTLLGQPRADAAGAGAFKLLQAALA